MHYDHVGVANEIEGATWLVQRPEHDAMFADPVSMPAAQPELYTNLRDADTVLLDGDHDVFGDGRLQILSAPGHTPGHQVLFLDLVETGPLVLSGDLYHFRLSREQRRVPIFNFGAEMTLASMERVEAFVTEVGATFWIEHELALFQELDKAPAGLLVYKGPDPGGQDGNPGLNQLVSNRRQDRSLPPMRRTKVRCETTCLKY